MRLKHERPIFLKETGHFFGCFVGADGIEPSTPRLKGAEPVDIRPFLMICYMAPQTCPVRT
jgi:hypothetical protein